MEAICTVRRLDGSQYRVKNFGWFMRHTADVLYCEFHFAESGSDCAGVFRAWTRNGGMFETRFGSFEVLRTTLNRCRNLRGVELSLYRGTANVKRTMIILGAGGSNATHGAAWRSYSEFYRYQAVVVRIRAYGSKRIVAATFE